MVLAVGYLMLMRCACRGRGGHDPRGIVEYRDLDALKEDSDTFFVMDES